MKLKSLESNHLKKKVHNQQALDQVLVQEMEHLLHQEQQELEAPVLEVDLETQELELVKVTDQEQELELEVDLEQKQEQVQDQVLEQALEQEQVQDLNQDPDQALKLTLH